jgi:hypothetical protein
LSHPPGSRWRSSGAVNTTERVQKARAVLDEAIGGVVHDDAVELSPSAVQEIEFWRNDPPLRNEVLPQRPKVPVSTAEASPVVRPAGLVDFLSRVGLRDDGGELAAMGLNDLFIPGKGRIVRKNGGLTLDEAREAAVEAGYIQDAGWNNPDVPSATTVDDLLNALKQDSDAYRNRDHAGRVYSVQDRERAAAYLDREAKGMADDQVSGFMDMARGDGHDIGDRTLMEYAAAHYGTHGGTVDAAIERAAIDLASQSSDVRAILDEELPGWDDAIQLGTARQGRQAPAGQGRSRAGSGAEGTSSGAGPAFRDAGRPQIPDPDPAIASAGLRVGKRDDLKALAVDLGVDPETGGFAEEIDIRQLEAEGRLTDDDRAELAAADLAFEQGHAYARALRAAMTCVLAAV